MKTIAVVLLIVMNSTVSAWAALGQSRESIKEDTARLNGKVMVTEMRGYAVHQITRDDGAVLREFVSPHGQVFGITWEGRTMPNLKDLLGPSAQAFQQATETTHPRRGPISLHLDNLVVETGGHMRDFHVRAYRLDMMPEGVTEDAVR